MRQPVELSPVARYARGRSEVARSLLSPAVEALAQRLDRLTATIVCNARRDAVQCLGDKPVAPKFMAWNP